MAAVELNRYSRSVAVSLMISHVVNRAISSSNASAGPGLPVDNSHPWIKRGEEERVSQNARRPGNWIIFFFTVKIVFDFL